VHRARLLPDDDAALGCTNETSWLGVLTSLGRLHHDDLAVRRSAGRQRVSSPVTPSGWIDGANG